MIDLHFLKNDPEKTIEGILRKEPEFDIERLKMLDQETKNLRSEVEALRKEKNELAWKGAQGLTPELREKSIELGKELKEKTKNLELVEQELKKLWLSCPNIPMPDVPAGNKEANKVIKEVGQKPEFSFAVKNHLELNDTVKWFDLQAAASITGTQFVVYNEIGTKLIYALTQLMLKNNAKHGFKPILPPTLVGQQALYNAGNLPKFEGDYYQLAQDEGLCLIPTSEVSLTNLNANKILDIEQMPLRMTSWTSCFRREAGGYGASDRGLIRIHQFEKVEIYSICEPEKSEEELEYMIACAENLLQQLGLQYRISLLAAQDCSFQSAKTYDIEVWLAGQKQFYEISSCSNCTDFQARRAGIRYRKSISAKPTLVHTLNASSLALPRLIVALMETYQQEDGTIVLPDILQEKMDQLW